MGVPHEVVATVTAMTIVEEEATPRAVTIIVVALATTTTTVAATEVVDVTETTLTAAAALIDMKAADATKAMLGVVTDVATMTATKSGATRLLDATRPLGTMVVGNTIARTDMLVGNWTSMDCASTPFFAKLWDLDATA